MGSPGIFQSQLLTLEPDGVSWNSYDRIRSHDLMGLLYELVLDNADASTTVLIEANSREEALEIGQEMYPGSRLALINPSPGEQF